MTKTAIYAMLRLITILPPLPSWCGLLLAIAGIAGALFGIAMASMQPDLKRSLAYSTVENIGIIFLALGAWLFCRGAGLHTAATLALAGGLLHIWNHSFFKGLLFLGAGSVLHATGTRELSAMGGLMRKMPLTGSFMMLGGAAISALPPFNGLISELVIYLSLLTAGQASGGATAFFFMLLVILLAMTGAMALLTVSRIIGVIFSGVTRSPLATAHEAPMPMLCAMLVPALLCLAIGIFPHVFLQFLQGPLAVLTPEQNGALARTLSQLPFGAAWSMTGLSLVLGLAAILIMRSRGRGTAPNLPTWGCGYSRPQSRMAYTACGFSQLIQDDVYCSCLRPQVEQSRTPQLFPQGSRHGQHNFDPMLRRLFAPLFVKLADVALTCRRLQAGQLGIYISYFFLTTVLLLGWIIFSARG